MKMKTWRLSLRREALCLRAVRPDVDVMMDCAKAREDTPPRRHGMTLARFEGAEATLLLASPDDVDNHARLARLTRIPIATGEIGYGRWYHKELLDRQAASILQSDALVCGGITEWRRIAATAASHGVVMAPHWFHDVHAPLVAATPNARFVEFFQDDQVLNFRRLIDRQLEHRDGRILLHQAPGLGFGFDERAVARHGRWQTVR